MSSTARRRIREPGAESVTAGPAWRGASRSTDARATRIISPYARAAPRQSLDVDRRRRSARCRVPGPDPQRVRASQATCRRHGPVATGDGWHCPSVDVHRRVLPRMPRSESAQGKARARSRRRRGPARACGRVGEGRSQASRAADAAGRRSPARRRHLRCRRRLARDAARSRRSGKAEPRPDGDDPAPHAHRVSERRPRSARARARRRRRCCPPTSRATASTT